MVVIFGALKSSIDKLHPIWCEVDGFRARNTILKSYRSDPLKPSNQNSRIDLARSHLG